MSAEGSSFCRSLSAVAGKPGAEAGGMSSYVPVPHVS